MRAIAPSRTFFLDSHITTMEQSDSRCVLGCEDGSVVVYHSDDQVSSFEGCGKTSNEIANSDCSPEIRNIASITYSNSSDLKNTFIISNDNCISVKKVRERRSTFNLLSKNSEQKSAISKVEIEDICCLDTHHNYPVCSLSLNKSNEVFISGDIFNIYLWDINRLTGFSRLLSFRTSENLSSVHPHLLTKSQFITESQIGCCFTNSSLQIFDINKLFLKDNSPAISFDWSKPFGYETSSNFIIFENKLHIRTPSAFIIYDLRNPKESFYSYKDKSMVYEATDDFYNNNLALCDNRVIFGGKSGKLFFYDGMAVEQVQILDVETNKCISNIVSIKNELYVSVSEKLIKLLIL